jgi:hypothetical protein
MCPMMFVHAWFRAVAIKYVIFVEVLILQKRLICAECDIEEYICPISRIMMETPVVTRLGVCYESTQIKQWLALKKVDPFSHLPLTISDLCPCLPLRALIVRYISDEMKKTDWRRVWLDVIE